MALGGHQLHKDVFPTENLLIHLRLNLLCQRSHGRRLNLARAPIDAAALVFGALLRRAIELARLRLDALPALLDVLKLALRLRVGLQLLLSQVLVAELEELVHGLRARPKHRQVQVVEARVCQCAHLPQLPFDFLGDGLPKGLPLLDLRLNRLLELVQL